LDRSSLRRLLLLGSDDKKENMVVEKNSYQQKIAEVKVQRSKRRGDRMSRNLGLRTALCAVAAFPTTRLVGQAVSLDPVKMARIGTVDERFQSYNIEMVEVIGGRFWKPYGSTTNESKAQESASGFRSGGHRSEPLSISSAH
jgi:hypothetical protein